MKRNVLFTAVGAFVVVVAAGAGGVYAWKHARVSSKPQVAQQDLQATIEAMKARAGNPDQKPYKDRNLTEIKSKMSEGDAAVRGRTVQSGIVFFDTAMDKEWKPSDYEEVATAALGNVEMVAKGHDEKRLRVLSFNLLLRLVPKFESAKFSERLNKIIGTKQTDPYDLGLYLDIASIARPVPSKFHEMNHKCMFGKDLGLAQQCIQSIEGIKDTKRRELEAHDLLADYKQLQSAIKPYAARVLISQHKLFEKPASDLLAEASKQTDMTWQDVFLYGVNELNAVETYRNELRTIVQKGESNVLRQRASAILESPKPASTTN